jgi:SAM-dependent methyltransferase
MMAEFQSSVYYRYLWRYDLRKSARGQHGAPTGDRQSHQRGEDEKQGTAFTSQGPAPYAGDILDDPELLWTEDVWDDKRVADARSKLAQQGDTLPAYWKQQYETKAGSFWHKFYKRNADHFYKDRHYLHLVFPELLQGADTTASAPLYLLEVGCGVGNAVLPLIELNRNIHVVAMDFANSAIEILNKHPFTHSCIDQSPTRCLTEADLGDNYFSQLQESSEPGNRANSSQSSTDGPGYVAGSTTQSASGGDVINEGAEVSIQSDMQHSTVAALISSSNRRVRTAVRDIVRDPLPVPAVSMDLALCMFVLSAIAPAEQLIALRKIAEALKPGGKLMVRDYGR